MGRSGMFPSGYESSVHPLEGNVRIRLYSGNYDTRGLGTTQQTLVEGWEVNYNTLRLTYDPCC